MSCPRCVQHYLIPYNSGVSIGFKYLKEAPLGGILVTVLMVLCCNEALSDVGGSHRRHILRVSVVIYLSCMVLYVRL